MIEQEGMPLHDDVFVTYTVFTFGIGNIVSNTVYVTNTSSCRGIPSCYIIETMLPIPKVNTVYVTNTSSCRDIPSCYIIETMLPIPKVNTVYVTNTSSCRGIPSCLMCLLHTLYLPLVLEHSLNDITRRYVPT
jgi:hypothetical protein